MVLAIGWRLHRGLQFLIDTTNTGRILYLVKTGYRELATSGYFSWPQTTKHVLTSRVGQALVSPLRSHLWSVQSRCGS
jgi:hypothetical protein